MRLLELTQRARDSAQFHLSRLVCEWSRTKPVSFRMSRGMVSFSFDDFPDSALSEGGKILESYGARGTFYASYGRMVLEGRDVARRRIEEVVKRGHEVGCHTFSHLDCAAASEAKVLEDIEENARAVEPLAGTLLHFAFPYGRVNRSVQRRLARRFQTCRGVFPGINDSLVDLSLLRANPLYGPRATFDSAQRMIRHVAARGGWVIFFTHDVGGDPTPYGCTPQALAEVVEVAVRYRCAVQPIGGALSALGEEDAVSSL